VIERRSRQAGGVLCDRFSDATYSVPSRRTRTARESVVGLERLVHPGLQPDATFLFDLDPAIAYERQRAQQRSADKFEREQAEFFRRVREAYLDRAREHSRRFHVIDASGTPQQVRDRLEVALAQAFA
jgi:dTMP kinase